MLDETTKCPFYVIVTWPVSANMGSLNQLNFGKNPNFLSDLTNTSHGRYNSLSISFETSECNACS